MKAKKKKGIFYSHFFHSGSRCALFFLSPICVSFVVQSSSRPVVVVFSQQHPRTKSARMDATLLHSFSRYVLRHIEPRLADTPRVCSLSLSLERGDSTRPERSACVSPFIEWSRRVEFLQNRGRVRPIESSTTAALLMRDTRKASFIYVVARR